MGDDLNHDLHSPHRGPVKPGTHLRPLSSPCNSGLIARPSLRAPRRDHAASPPPRQSRQSPVTSLQAPPRPAPPACGLVPLAGLGPPATVHDAKAFRPRGDTHATLRRTRTAGHVWPCLARSASSSRSRPLTPGYWLRSQPRTPAARCAPSFLPLSLTGRGGGGVEPTSGPGFWVPNLTLLYLQCDLRKPSSISGPPPHTWSHPTQG